MSELAYSIGGVLVVLGVALLLVGVTVDACRQVPRGLPRLRDQQPWIDEASEDLSLDDLRRHCADVEPDPVVFTREGGYRGLPNHDRTRAEKPAGEPARERAGESAAVHGP